MASKKLFDSIKEYINATDSEISEANDLTMRIMKSTTKSLKKGIPDDNEEIKKIYLEYIEDIINALSESAKIEDRYKVSEKKISLLKALKDDM